jgi:hypothetical protein
MLEEITVGIIGTNQLIRTITSTIIVILNCLDILFVVLFFNLMLYKQTKFRSKRKQQYLR